MTSEDISFFSNAFGDSSVISNEPIRTPRQPQNTMEFSCNHEMQNSLPSPRSVCEDFCLPVPLQPHSRPPSERSKRLSKLKKKVKVIYMNQNDLSRSAGLSGPESGRGQRAVGEVEDRTYDSSPEPYRIAEYMRNVSSRYACVLYTLH